MNIRTVILILAVLPLFPAVAHAQFDERDSGIYPAVGDTTTALTSTACRGAFAAKYGTWLFDIPSTVLFNYYKDESSGFETSPRFVLVIDHKKKYYVSPYDITTTPCCLKLIPLTVNTQYHRREYIPVGPETVGILNWEVERPELYFEWYRISENSFEITIPEIASGEYAFIFYGNENGIYAFTIK